jgi:hypothetical protein
MTGTSRQVDLSRETARELESTQARFGSIWRRQALIVIGGGIALGLAAWIGGRLASWFVEQAEEPVGLFLWSSGVLLCYVGLIASVGVVGWGLWMSVAGAPKSGTTADKTVRQYLRPFLGEMGNALLPQWLPAFVCLLDQTKAEQGGYEAFVKASRGTAWSIAQQIRLHIGEEAFERTTKDPKKVGVSLSGQSDRECTCQANVPVPYSQDLVLSFNLVQVGGRWYLAQVPTARLGDRVKGSSQDAHVDKQDEPRTPWLEGPPLDWQADKDGDSAGD